MSVMSRALTLGLLATLVQGGAVGRELFGTDSVEAGFRTEPGRILFAAVPEGRDPHFL